MRMKKLIILAVAAIALVACSRTFEHHATEPAQIGFSTWAENLTKTEARVQGTSTFLAGDTFAVYGYKDKDDNSDPNVVFDHDGTNDVVVTASGNPVDDWDYPNHRFWDSNYDKYIFYAISPSQIGLDAGVSPTTGAITSASITFSGKNNDILVADKKQVDKGSAPYFSNFSTVPLVFNHVASLVDFRVKKTPSLGDATVTVTAFELSNVDSQGSLSVSAAYTDTHPVASWTEPGTARSSYGPGDGVNSVNLPIEIDEDTGFDAANPGTPSTATNATTSTYLINNLVAMPQLFRASNGENPQKLTITYKIAVTGSSDVEYTSEIYLNQFDFEDDDYNSTAAYVTRWEPGKHYTFFITLDAHVIDFSATITDWTSISGYHYLVN